MTLVDTSVWIDHLRAPNRNLVRLLTDGQVLAHPFVTGELACGNLKNRVAILSSLAALPSAIVASNTEVLHLLDLHKLHGKGIGWVDAHLLASTLLSNCPLYTLDKRLAQVASDLGRS